MNITVTFGSLLNLGGYEQDDDIVATHEKYAKMVGKLLKVCYPYAQVNVAYHYMETVAMTVNVDDIASYVTAEEIAEDIKFATTRVMEEGGYTVKLEPDIAALYKQVK